jgi:thioredoxin-like negative regulator of GroEL
MRAVYIDCGKSPGICAQHGIFSLPAVKVYIEGMLVAEDARVFSLHALLQRINKSYALWMESKQQ